MNTLRRARRWGRLLAAWLLLWFIAMGAMPMESTGAPEAVASVDEHCAHAQAHDPQDHAAHAAGGASHCPLCMQAAAPPPPQVAQRLPGEAPTPRPVTGERAPVHVRTAAPPPGRGPPVFS